MFNVEGYGLDKVGVVLIDCKVIGVDDYMCINVGYIYVIGDVNGLL